MNANDIITSLTEDGIFTCITDYREALRTLQAECRKRGITTRGLRVVWHDTQCEVHGPYRRGERTCDKFVTMHLGERSDYDSHHEANAFAKALRLAQVIKAA